MSAAPAGAAVWVEPVNGPIIDPFRPPSGPYGPGNRGIEYDIESGTPVIAVDAGRVSFVGRIGASMFVSIDHGEGLKSTYAYIESSVVVRGQRVKKGQQVAVAGPGFHLTARLFGEYVDPEILFGGAEIEVNLVDGPQLSQPRATSGLRPRLQEGQLVANWALFGGLLDGRGIRSGGSEWS